MNDEKQNNELDNFFREEIENLPQEQPSARDWEQMSKRIQSEGLFEKRNGRKYLLLILLFVLFAGLVSLPFFIKDKNKAVVRTEIKSSEITKKDLSTENKIPEPAKTETASDETTPKEKVANSEN